MEETQRKYKKRKETKRTANKKQETRQETYCQKGRGHNRKHNKRYKKIKYNTYKIKEATRHETNTKHIIK